MSCLFQGLYGLSVDIALIIIAVTTSTAYGQHIAMAKPMSGYLGLAISVTHPHLLPPPFPLNSPMGIEVPISEVDRGTCSTLAFVLPK